MTHAGTCAATAARNSSGPNTATRSSSSTDDNLRAVHTLSQLTGDDLGFRMLMETVGNSEQAFLMLPAAQWQALEAEFGAAAVARRFAPMAPDFDTFMEEVFAY